MDAVKDWVALAIAMLALVTSLFALVFSRRQTIAAEGVLDVERQRDGKSEVQAALDRRANLTIEVESPTIKNVRTIAIRNEGPAHAGDIRAKVESVADGGSAPVGLDAGLAAITGLSPNECAVVRMVLEPKCARSVAVSIGWTDERRQLQQFWLDLGRR